MAVEQNQDANAIEHEVKTSLPKKYWLKKYLKWLFVSFSLLIILIILLATWLLATASGSKFVFNYLFKYQNIVDASYVQGSILSKLELHDIKIEQANLPQVFIQKLVYDIDFWKIFNKTVSFNSIDISDIKIILPESKSDVDKPEPSKLDLAKISFQHIKLPIDFELHHLTLNHFELLQKQKPTFNLMAEINQRLLQQNYDNSLSPLAKIDQLQISLLLKQENWQAQIDQLQAEITQPEFNLKLENNSQIAINPQLDKIDFTSELSANLSLNGLMAKPPNLRVNYVQYPAFTTSDVKNNLQIPLTIKLRTLGFLDDLAFTLDSNIDLKKLALSPLKWTSSFALKKQEKLSFASILKNQKSNLSIKGYADLTKNIYLALNTNVTDFSEFIPKTKGALLADLLVKGQFPSLELQGKINAHDLQYDQIKIDKIDLNSNLSSNLQGDLQFNLENLQLASTIIKAAQLIIKGSDDHHQINAKVRSDLFSVATQLSGKIEAPQPISPQTLAWNGSLETLDIGLPQLGDLSLERASNLLISQAKIDLQALCLKNSRINICLDALRTPETIKSHIELKDFAFADLLNNKVDNLKLTTKLQAKADVELKNNTNLTLSGLASLDRGNLEYLHQGNKINIPLNKTEIKIQGNEQSLNSNLVLDWGDYLQGKSEVILKDILSSKQLSGSGDFTVSNLKWAQNILPPDAKSLEAKINAQFNLAGNLMKPLLEAKLSLLDGAIKIPEFQTNISNVNINVSMPNDLSALNLDGSLKIGEGKADLTGNLALQKEKRFTLNVKGDQLLLANTDQARVIVSPNAKLEGTPEKMNLTGEILVPQMQINLNAGKKNKSVIKSSDDLLIVSNKQAPKVDPLANLNIDFKIILGDKINIRYDDFSGKLEGELVLSKLIHQPIRGTGDITIAKGDYEIYGQKLKLRKGKILFSGGLLTNPGLDIEAAREIDDNVNGGKVIAGVKIVGSLNNPKLGLYSSPAMVNTSVISYLLLGRAPNGRSGGETLMLLHALRKLASNDTSKPTESIASRFGLDEIGVNQDTSGNASVGIGKKINDKLYVGYVFSILTGEMAFKLRYQLNSWLNLDAQSSSTGTNVDLLYTKEK